MHKIKLTQDEKSILTGYFQKSPLMLMRLKSQAIIMRDGGLKEKQIANFLGKGDRTIKRWVKDYANRRLASIFSGHKNNENASKLTRSQKREIKEILKSPPSEYNLPKGFWDVPALKSYLKAVFGVVYESRQSYHFLLKFGGLSFKQPAKFDIHRDERKISERIKEIQKEIKPYIDNPDWEIFTSDETRIMWEAITRRAWLKKGVKTVIRVERKRESQNYIGFLNLKSNKFSIHRLSWQNQKEVLVSLKKLLKKYPKKKICIIWDNASFHKGKIIRNALGRGNILEKVHLIPLPPYAPDMNPVENVWGKLKKDISNKQFSNFNVTKRRFESKARSQKFKYKTGHFVLS